MVKTTAPPRADVLEAVPELAKLATTSIRLHPRRGDVPELSGSKIGGKFLWPNDEAWPTILSQYPLTWTSTVSSVEFEAWRQVYPDGTPVALLPILQINAHDVPDFSFPSGNDLFQLFWLPLAIDEPPYHWVIRVCWRNSKSVLSPLTDISLPSFVSPSPFLGAVPKPCKLTFEVVNEYPSCYELPYEVVQRIEAWQGTLSHVVFEDEHYQSKNTLYDYELSVCPSSKLGGYVCWIQEPQRLICACGHPMEHLLTLSDCEVDGGTWPRWLPLEDREGWRGAYSDDERVDAPGWHYLGGGSLYLFVCRFCSHWPVKALYQR